MRNKQLRYFASVAARADGCQRCATYLAPPANFWRRGCGGDYLMGHRGCVELRARRWRAPSRGRRRTRLFGWRAAILAIAPAFAYGRSAICATVGLPLCGNFGRPDGAAALPADASRARERSRPLRRIPASQRCSISRRGCSHLFHRRHRNKQRLQSVGQPRKCARHGLRGDRV